MVVDREAVSDTFDQFLVGGQSGASLEIIRSPGGPAMVLKKPGSAGTEKLLQQCSLLRELRLIPGYKNFVPVVRGEMPDGSYLTDFFPGKKLGHWLQFSGPTSIEQVAHSLAQLLAPHSANLASIDTAKVEKKVEELRSKFSKLNLPLNRLLWLSEKLDTARDALVDPAVQIDESLPHGDFSFENILVSSDASQICLVDPNPSPIHSKLMDVARLRLDLVHGWWENGLVEGGQYRVNRMTLMSLLKPNWEETPIVRFMTAFFALRIVPYTANPMRLAYLYDAIENDLELVS